MNTYDKICADLERLNPTDREWRILCRIAQVVHYAGSRHGSPRAHIAWVRRKQARGAGFGRCATTLHAMIALAVE
jgi:hypothetical protein